LRSARAAFVVDVVALLVVVLAVPLVPIVEPVEPLVLPALVPAAVLSVVVLPPAAGAGVAVGVLDWPGPAAGAAEPEEDEVACARAEPARTSEATAVNRLLVVIIRMAP
jgi:hypothetical protein